MIRFFLGAAVVLAALIYFAGWVPVKAQSPCPHPNFVCHGELGEIAGPQGEQGEQGERGPRGPRGPRGRTGATGETGEMGPAGLDGADGADGIDGIDGRDFDKSALGLALGTPVWLEFDEKFSISGSVGFAEGEDAGFGVGVAIRLDDNTAAHGAIGIAGDSYGGRVGLRMGFK